MDKKSGEKVNANNWPSKLSDLNLDNKETRVLNEEEQMQLHVESDEPLKVGQVIKGPDGPLILLKMEGSDELYAVPCNENGAIAIGESSLIQNDVEPLSELQNNIDTLMYYDFSEKFGDQILSTPNYSNDIFNVLYNSNTNNINDSIELPQTNQNNNYLPDSYLINDFIAEQNYTNLQPLDNNNNNSYNNNNYISNCNNNNLNNVKQDSFENLFDKYQYFDSTSKIDDILNVPISKTEENQFNYDFQIDDTVANCFENSNQLLKLQLPQPEHEYSDIDKDPCPVYLDFNFDNVCQEPTTLHTQLQEQLQKSNIDNKISHKEMHYINENSEVLNSNPPNEKCDILNAILKDSKLPDSNVTCSNINFIINDPLDSKDSILKNDDSPNSNNDVSYTSNHIKNENNNDSIKSEDTTNSNYEINNNSLVIDNSLIKQQPQNYKMKLSEYAEYTNQIATANKIYSPNASSNVKKNVKIFISNYNEANVIEEIKLEKIASEKDNVLSHITLSQLIEPIYRPPLKTKKCTRKQYNLTELQYNNENSLEKEFDVIDKQTIDIPVLTTSNSRRGRKQTLETINVTDMDLIFTCELSKAKSSINTDSVKKKLNACEKDDMFGGTVKRGRPKKQTTTVCEQPRKKVDSIDSHKLDENKLKRKCDNDCDTIEIKEDNSNTNNKIDCVSKRLSNKKLKPKDTFEESDSSDTDGSYGRFESFPDEFSGQKLTLKCNICLKLFKTLRSLFIHQKRCTSTECNNDNEPKLDEQLGTFTLIDNNIENEIDYDKDIEEIEYLDEYFDTEDNNIVNNKNVVLINNDKNEEKKTVIKNVLKVPDIIVTTPNNHIKSLVNINNKKNISNNKSNESKKLKNKINNNNNNSFNHKNNNNNVITSPKIINKINTRSSSTSSLSITETIISSHKNTLITKPTSNDIIKNNILNPNMNKCNICNKLFRQKNHLNAHKRTHDLLLKCKHCNKIFALKQTYDTHLRTKCLKIPEIERRKLFLEKSKTIHNNTSINNNIRRFNVSNNIFNGTKIIPSSSSLLVVNQMPHSGVTLSPNKQKRCNHCKSLIPIKAYVKHLATHVKKK